MYSPCLWQTEQKKPSVQLDLNAKNNSDILVAGGLVAATVGLCLLGNTKGAKKTAEAAAKTAEAAAKTAAQGAGNKKGLLETITGWFKRKPKAVTEAVTPDAKVVFDENQLNAIKGRENVFLMGFR